MHIDIPYGHTKISVDLPGRQVVAVCEPKQLPGLADERGELERALDEPLGTPRLEELAKGKRDAVVVVDDITRPVPYPLVLEPVVGRLVRGGIPLEKITVMIATGLHRQMTEEEMARVLGGYAGKIRIRCHNADDPNETVELCTTSLGTRIRVNKYFMAAELKVLTGDVDYHQFCGYGGGAKSVYPGMVDREGVQTNHSRMEIEGTGPGRIEGNPVRMEIEEVGRAAGASFILNVVQNTSKQIVGAYAGDLIEAHRAGAKLVDSMFRVAVPRRADVVISSPGGYPKDICLYQAQKALQAARKVVKPGGKIFILAECEEGHGSDLFDQWMEAAYTLDDIFARIREKFIMGGHKAYQFARDIEGGEVFMMSKNTPGKIRQYFMTPIKGPDEILARIGPEEEIIVLPQATLTLAEVA